MIRVGVFFGGLSIEREASFNSGRTVCDHIDIARYRVIPIFHGIDGKLYILPQRFLHRGKISDFEHRLAAEATALMWDDLPAHIDFAFLALHGRYAEDGTVQGMLSLLGIPYLGSRIYASALSRDKGWLKKIVTAQEIRTAPGTSISVAELRAVSDWSSEETRAYITERIAPYAYPLIIKPSHEGSSLGVQIATTIDAAIEAIVHAATISRPIYQDVIIEEQLTGMEFSCIIITDLETGRFVALPPTEIVPEEKSALFDYEQKYMPGRGHKYTPARCSLEQQERIKESCIQTAQALHVTNFARIDGFIDAADSITIIDVNTLGGMAPASFMFLQAAEIGMSHTQLINHLIDTELQTNPAAHHNTTPLPIAERPEKLRVAVLMGGASAERETSLDSGRNITYKLSPHRYEVLPIFVTQEHTLYRMEQHHIVKNSTAEIAAALLQERLAQQLPADTGRIRWHELSLIADFVFIGLHGGFGENGGVQGALELLKIPYNGSGVASSALCMNKYETNQLLRAAGLCVPGHLMLATDMNDHAYLNDALQKAGISFPLISKPHDDGCSVFVHKHGTIAELSAAMAAMHRAGRPSVLIEELISGMELTVGVLGNSRPRALPPTYTVATGGVLSIEEKFLPGAGENQTPAPLPAESITMVQQIIERAYQIAGCRGYARIDCFYQRADESPTGSARVVILEINTLPALTPATCLFHQAAEVGISPMELLDTIITLGISAAESAPLERREACLPARTLRSAGALGEIL